MQPKTVGLNPARRLAASHFLYFKLIKIPMRDQQIDQALTLVMPLYSQKGDDFDISLRRALSSLGEAVGKVTPAHVFAALAMAAVANPSAIPKGQFESATPGYGVSEFIAKFLSDPTAVSEQAKRVWDQPAAAIIRRAFGIDDLAQTTPIEIFADFDRSIAIEAAQPNC